MRISGSLVQATLVMVSACGGSVPAERSAARADDAPRITHPGAPEAAEETPLDPERALGGADAIYRDQLAIQGRDERFSTDRQVAELRRAIALYQQFIARADGDPRFEEAVRRSRDRIADAEQTIDFLTKQGEGR